MEGRVASLLEVGTGFHPELTGRENVYFNGSILGMKKKEIDAKFDEIVEFSGVEKFLDTPVKFYSSGMYVRLAFAVAANLEPDILIVDEVLAVGDADFQKKCLGKMQDVAGQGRTVIFVSHSMDSVRKLCSRAILLEKGKVIYDGEVSKGIGKYLNPNAVKSAGVYKFKKDNKKKAQFVKIEFYNQNNEKTSHFKNNEDWKVAMNLYSNISVAKALVRLEIFSNDDTLIFATSSSDSKNIINNIEKGASIYEVSMPNNLLVPGDYYLRANIQQPGVHLYDNSIDMNIKILPDEKDIRQSYFEGKYFGYIGSKLKWISSASKKENV